VNRRIDGHRRVTKLLSYGFQRDSSEIHRLTYCGSAADNNRDWKILI